MLHSCGVRKNYVSGKNKGTVEYAQEAGLSLSDSMYAPHVFVCVRVRGAFKKKIERERERGLGRMRS